MAIAEAIGTAMDIAVAVVVGGATKGVTTVITNITIKWVVAVTTSKTKKGRRTNKICLLIMKRGCCFTHILRFANTPLFPLDHKHTS